MKISRISVLAVAACLLLAGCSKTRGSREGGFTGTFTDEFGNQFTLNEDMTSIVTISGAQPDTTQWSDGDNHDQDYATITYNYDPNYFFLKDGKLYNSRKAMEQGHPAIEIHYED